MCEHEPFMRDRFLDEKDSNDFCPFREIDRLKAKIKLLESELSRLNFVRCVKLREKYWPIGSW